MVGNLPTELTSTSACLTDARGRGRGPSVMTCVHHRKNRFVLKIYSTCPMCWFGWNWKSFTVVVVPDATTLLRYYATTLLRCRAASCGSRWP